MTESNDVTSAVTAADVDIAPDVRVLGVFRHLNYRPWYALAEFVDNALDSFLTNRRRIEEVDGRPVRLTAKVVVDTAEPGSITVSDNAAGIPASDWKRALKPAEPPPATCGLSEFGMGMKTAACWFGRQLDVDSKALGEPLRRSVRLDFDEIVASRTRTVRLVSSTGDPRVHGTTVAVRGDPPTTANQDAWKGPRPPSQHVPGIPARWHTRSHLAIRWRPFLPCWHCPYLCGEFGKACKNPMQFYKLPAIKDLHQPPQTY